MWISLYVHASLLRNQKLNLHLLQCIFWWLKSYWNSWRAHRTNYLKNEFEMKDLGKIKFCLNLQIEHSPNEVLIHQSTYIKKILKHFYIDKVHSLSSPMVVWSLDVKKKTHFVLTKKVKSFLVLKYHILVLLVHLYILSIVYDQTLFFLSIY